MTSFPRHAFVSRSWPLNRPGLPMFIACAAAFGGLLAPPTPAAASLLVWTGNASTLASNPNNWSPVQAPAAADDLSFGLNGAYSVTFNSAAPASHTQIYKHGTITVAFTSPHSASAGFDVSDVSGDNALVTFSSGDITSGGTVSIGDASGATGSLTLDGSDVSLLFTGVSSDLNVGRAGTGTLNVLGGGLAEISDDFIIGALASGVGTTTVSGGTGAFPSAVLSEVRTTSATGGDMFIGNSGDGTLHVLNGGRVHSARDIRIATSSSAVGTVDVGGNFGVFFTFLTADRNLDISRNDSIFAGGDASLTLNSGGIASAADLTRIGDADGGSGTLAINTGGVLNGSGVVIAPNGTLVMGGGFASPDDPIDNLAGGVITGFGTIDSGIDNAGTITPTGTGLVINGVLANTTSDLISGTKINFGPGGGYEGSGTCEADITGDAASHIALTGTLEIGRNTTAGFSYNGDIDVGGNILKLVDSNGAVLGGTCDTTINSGRIECPTGIGLSNGGSITGDGLFTGDMVVSGLLDPHRPNASGGLFTVQGDLVMNPTGIVDIEIGGTPGGPNNDKVVVSGTASFGGTIRVKLKNGFVPQKGQQFIAVNAAGGRTGEFDQIVVEGGNEACNGTNFVMVYSSTAAIILTRPPDADLNNDSKVDIDDLFIVINHWGEDFSSVGEADGLDIITGVNVDDLFVVINHWGLCP